MTSHVKLRKERAGVVDYETQIKDYLRRRSEIEGEYARSLDKLAERFTSKIKRKEPCSGQSVAQCWLVLLAQTRQESKDHSGCSDVGYHLSLSRVLRSYLSSRSLAQQNLSGGLQQLHTVVSGLDQIQDRDNLLQTHTNTFCLPLRFHYQPHEGDQAGKTLQAARSALMEGISDDDLDPPPSNSQTQGSLLHLQSPSQSQGQGGSSESLASSSSRPSLARRRANLQETEALYYALKQPLVISPVRVRSKSQPSVQFTHKLFTGDMLSFIQASGQEIPVVVESCIRFINLNGLHHEGIFRVPGSQGKVNSLRDAFEREIDNETERAVKLKSVISSYPPPVIIVMRYLFAFLHHVSQYSDENMMQPYNLAVCFGPSLLRGAQDDDVVTLQPQINSLVKSIILQHESIFPSPAELQGPVYEKCMTLEQDDWVFVRAQDLSSSEDITVQVDKEVCRQMNSVFKELLSRQSLPPDSSTSSHPPPQQKKGGIGTASLTQEEGKGGGGEGGKEKSEGGMGHSERGKDTREEDDHALTESIGYIEIVLDMPPSAN
ncbi:unnamed protein product [Coregonus sp. 'balchen']|nr:unnamed protein product [Coregonus sp. 'balchen']